MNRKRIFLLVGLAFTTLNAAAQENEEQENDLKSKKGLVILPESGDIALGVDALPFLNYVGNMMNGATGNSSGFRFVDNTQTIFGKYFLSKETAVRAAFRIGVFSNETGNYVRAMDATSPNDEVLDTRTQNFNNFSLSGGLEKRRGKTRIQGFYGVEGFIGVSSATINYDYGNAFTSSNPSVFFTNNFNSGSELQGSSRILQSTVGTAWSFGVRGFIGVEYFIAPKLSLGGEFGWGPSYTSQADGINITERTNFGEVELIEERTGGGSGFNMDTDNMFGAIKVLFHF